MIICIIGVVVSLAIAIIAGFKARAAEKELCNYLNATLDIGRKNMWK